MKPRPFFLIFSALALPLTLSFADDPNQPEEIFSHEFLGGNPGIIQSAGEFVLIPSPGEELGFWSTAGDADTAVWISVIAPEDPPYQSLNFGGLQTIRTEERFYFTARRTVASLPLDIWVSDGTQAGTYRIVDSQAIGLANNTASIRYFATFGDTIAFAATLLNTNEHRVFVINESEPNNVIRVPELEPFIGAAYDRMRELNGNLYVSSSVDGDRSLWRINPGNFTATQVWSMGGSSPQRVPPADLMTAGGVLYFRARDDTNAHALWRLGAGGTDAIRLHHPANSPPEAGDFRGSTRLIGAQNRLFFFASQWDTTNPDNPFWRNDLRLGTSQGTEISTETFWRHDLGSGWTVSTVANDEFGTAGNQLIFKSPPSANGGRQWWRSDGSAEGTQPVVINSETIPAPGLPSGTGASLAQDEGGVWVSNLEGSIRRRLFFIGPSNAESFAVPGEFNRLENFHAHAGRFWFTVQAPVGGNRSSWRVCPSCLGDSIFNSRFEEEPES